MFRTARLWAEPLDAAHFDDLMRFHGDPRHQVHLGGLRDDAWTRAYIERNLRHWEQHGFGLWMLRLDPAGPVIGRGLLRHLDLDGMNEVEIGYGFVPEVWGRGLATEIAQACLEQGRARGFTSLVALAAADNLASRRVLEKVGMLPEREVVHAGLPLVLYRTL